MDGDQFRPPTPRGPARGGPRRPSPGRNPPPPLGPGLRGREGLLPPVTTLPPIEILVGATRGAVPIFGPVVGIGGVAILGTAALFELLRRKQLKDMEEILQRQQDAIDVKLKRTESERAAREVSFKEFEEPDFFPDLKPIFIPGPAGPEIFPAPRLPTRRRLPKRPRRISEPAPESPEIQPDIKPTRRVKPIEKPRIPLKRPGTPIKRPPSPVRRKVRPPANDPAEPKKPGRFRIPRPDIIGDREVLEDAAEELKKAKKKAAEEAKKLSKSRTTKRKTSTGPSFSSLFGSPFAFFPIFSISTQTSRAFSPAVPVPTVTVATPPIPTPPAVGTSAPPSRKQKRCKPCPKKKKPKRRLKCFKGLYKEGPMSDDLDKTKWSQIDCRTGKEL